MKRFCKIIMSIILMMLISCKGIIPIIIDVHASDIAEYLSKIKHMEPAFLNEISIDECSTSPVKTPWGDAELVRFFNDDSIVGYYIILNGTILEFAEGGSPYDLITLSKGKSYYYDFATYGTIEGEPRFEGTLETDIHTDSIFKDDPVRFDLTQDSSANLTGFPHALQGETDNCIACSLTHVIWYWSAHGYSALTAGYTYIQVKNTIHAGFYGNYANNSVLSVAQSYGSSHGLISFSGGAIWNPSVLQMVGEINAGYPCMVGFKSPNPFYGSHMTACHGYEYYVLAGNFYVIVADGLSTSEVHRIWNSSYNDCVIRLRIQ